MPTGFAGTCDSRRERANEVGHNRSRLVVGPRRPNRTGAAIQWSPRATHVGFFFRLERPHALQDRPEAVRVAGVGYRTGDPKGDRAVVRGIVPLLTARLPFEFDRATSVSAAVAALEDPGAPRRRPEPAVSATDRVETFESFCRHPRRRGPRSNRPRLNQVRMTARSPKPVPHSLRRGGVQRSVARSKHPWYTGHPCSQTVPRIEHARRSA